MANEKILVVDDENDILELVRYNLETKGYQISLAMTGEEAIESAKSSKPDLIILDLMLPGIDGLEVCRNLKSEPETKKIPIIMLTAKGEEADIVMGLELGADDYITKPFSIKVLIARVRTALRKYYVSEDKAQPANIITRGPIKIDYDKHEVLLNENPLELTLTEFSVLNLLAKRPGRVFTRYQIVDATKGENYIVTDRAVDVQIVGLRKKLGEYGKMIKTVRGVGYKFELIGENN